MKPEFKYSLLENVDYFVFNIQISAIDFGY